MDYPVKKARTLHTTAEVAAAREAIARDPEAARLRDQLVQAADRWQGWSDARLASLVIPPCVPRAFNISFSGCPVHGREAFKTGNYSFKIDLDRPFTVVCPVGGEEYPSNDFAAFLATGMKDRSLLTGPYADDGWGWKKEGEDKKYWFVAYYTHWSYLSHVIPGALNLSRAYLLTGNPGYAHRAIILLDRIADVYPAMDHNKQSRYATEFAPSYTGKIVNLIWETGVGRSLCEAYDNVWDAIDADAAAQRFLGKTGPEIRANIERNLVREVMEGVYQGTIRGNFGMHQDTLLTAAVVAQAGDEARVTDYLLNNTGEGFALEGYRYALANYFTREGMSCRETAPGYCGIWPDQLVGIASLLKRLGTNLFDDRVRQLMLARERMIMLDAFTPAIGDSGSVTSGALRVTPRMAAVGYREYHDPVFARTLRRAAGAGAARYADYEDLFHTPITLPSDLPAAPPPTADLMDNYGLAMLRSARQPVQWSLFYGPSPGHGHYDKLNIELFALGRRLLPDLGYPQFAADDPEPPGWSRNTICHNTVVVNARRQLTVRPGTARTFASLPGLQVVEVDAPEAYEGLTTLYRRTLVSVDTPAGAYGVDIFRVRGGRQHDYSLHGPEGEFTTGGLSLTEPQIEGTLAGKDVPYAFFYDDPRFAARGERQGYHRYAGSGFSFLTNVQRAPAAKPWWADWRLPGEVGHLRITRLPQGPQEEIVCDGKPPFNPTNPAVLKYTLSRRQGESALASTFVSLIEPYAGQRQVTSARSLTRGQGEDPVALEIRRPEGLDLLVSTAGKPWQGREGTCSARLALLGTDGRGRLARALAVGQGAISGPQGVLMAGPDLAGRVVAVDYGKREVTLRVERGKGVPAAALVGCMARFSNQGRVGAFFVAAAAREGDRLMLTFTESPAAGLVLVSGYDQKKRILHTRTHLPQTDVRRYDGLTLADEAARPQYRVLGASGDPADLRLAPLAGSAGLADGDGDGRVLGYLYEVGPGDRAEISAQVWVEPAEDGYAVQANTGFALALPAGAPTQATWQPEVGSPLPLKGTREGGLVRFRVPAAAVGNGRGTLRWAGGG